VGAVFFAALAGVLFGVFAVVIRQGLQRGGDPELGAVVVTGIGTLVSAVLAVRSAAAGDVHPGDLWPFLLIGALVPGVTQILFIVAIRDIGPSRVAILVGTAPLMSVAIALAFLDEPFQPLLVLGTVLVVAGGAALARERSRPEHFRAFGIVLALACAALFAVRDNVARWAARDTHPPALAASTAALLGSFLVVLAWVLIRRRSSFHHHLRAALPAFALAGVVLGLAYSSLLEAFDRGRVSIVAPLNATQSLWAVFFAALLIGRHSERIGPRLVAAGALVVVGSAIIGILR
jgi:drug/metabolite transporter (DMT)-like permease